MKMRITIALSGLILFSSMANALPIKESIRLKLVGETKLVGIAPDKTQYEKCVAVAGGPSMFCNMGPEDQGGFKDHWKDLTNK